MFIATGIMIAAVLAAPQRSNMTHAAEAMGFDQTTTRHDFGIEADGGSIAVDVKDGADFKTRDQIRMHLRRISSAFKQGDFSLPLLTHSEMPAGAPVMTQKRDVITYTYADTPRGGIVRIRTKDAAALDAIHAFLRYQIAEHKTDAK